MLITWATWKVGQAVATFVDNSSRKQKKFDGYYAQYTQKVTHHSR